MNKTLPIKEEQLTLLIEAIIDNSEDEQDVVEAKGFEDLYNWVCESKENEDIYANTIVPDFIHRKLAERKEIELSKQIDIPLILQRIKIRVIGYQKFKWMAAASVGFLLLLAGYLFVKDNNSTGKEVVKIKPVKDIDPGTSKAVLTLADGSTITLDNTVDGAIARQQNMQIINSKGQQLSYKRGSGSDSRPATAEILYNTISTPAGGQYQLVLPDGSKVWLNAASSLTFPIQFSGPQRKVILKGEAYFEITKNALSTFLVNSGTMDVQVLGTSFNVSGYKDEAEISATLVEGSIKVICNNTMKIITPGQQVKGTKDGQLVLNNSANVEQVIAWKNGDFLFEKDDLKTVMKQIGRWYDVEVIYERYTPGRVFSGIMKRNKKLSEVLDVLSQNNIQYRIGDKKLYIKS